MTYIVKLTPTAQRILQNLEPHEQRALHRALRKELTFGPNADKEIRFDADGNAPGYADPDSLDDKRCYTATPLSYKAYTAVHRPMSKDELRRETQESDHRGLTQGFYVFDILPAESAFRHGLGG